MQNAENIAAEAGENRISVVSILVFNRESAERVNSVLSSYGEYIIGRMGIPYKRKNVSVLSVALDAPVEITNALTGKLGKTEGVSVKALFGKIRTSRGRRLRGKNFLEFKFCRNRNEGPLKCL